MAFALFACRTTVRRTLLCRSVLFGAGASAALLASDGVNCSDKPTIERIIGTLPMTCKNRALTKEGFEASKAFKAQAGDVVISTFAKTGTTYLQQVCHQLRTGGDVNFDEISEEGIVPWLEQGPSIGIDIDLPQTAQPRCFKTHQTLSRLAHLDKDGAKFLCTVRDPEKTLLSSFKFRLAKGVCDTTDINVFIKSSFVLGPAPGNGSTLWQYFAEYWKCRHLHNVKVLVFERITMDLDAYLDDLNDFMELPPLDAKRRAVVLKYSHKDWMLQNDHLFDDHHVDRRIEKRDGFVKKRGVSKVGLEVSSDVNVVLNDESKAILDNMWKKEMLPVTGCTSYAEMIKHMR